MQGLGVAVVQQFDYVSFSTSFFTSRDHDERISPPTTANQDRGGDMRQCVNAILGAQVRRGQREVE